MVMLTLRSILCPVDFSDQSQEALRWAVALAAQHRSRLTVLTAVDPLLAQAAKARLNLDLSVGRDGAGAARVRESRACRQPRRGRPRRSSTCARERRPR